MVNYLSRSKNHCLGSLYRLGLALLDLDDPSKVIKRCNEWVFGPNEYYERVGDVLTLLFPAELLSRVMN
jgi:predicted GH43/DUF377 family glycosyl hydrolase